MEPHGASINVPTFDGTPREVGEVWKLRKAGRVASCALWTHPKGGEARLTVDGEWHRGEALGRSLELLDVAMQWRNQFIAKGWSDKAGDLNP